MSEIERMTITLPTEMAAGQIKSFDKNNPIAGGRQGRANPSSMSQLVDQLAPQPAKSMIDSETERAVQAFLKRLKGEYPIIDALLYGSRARGDHSRDSDADLALILEGEKGDRYKIVRDLGGVGFDIMMETGILVHAMPFWEDEFQEPERFNNQALISKIKREGVRL